MDEPHGNGTSSDSSEGRRKGGSLSSSKHCSSSSCSKSPAEAVEGVAPQSVPCRACKFLRRKCVNGCIFAPYCGMDQGAAKFAVVHKVFGASNASKVLPHMPVTRRHDAVVTICYEAQAWLADPVSDACPPLSPSNNRFSLIDSSALVTHFRNVASVRVKLALVQAQLTNNRYAEATVLPGSDQKQQQLHLSSHRQPNIPATLQPSYSNNSATSNIINIGSFAPGFNVPLASSSSHNLERLRFSPRDEEEEEEESRIPAAFAANFLRR